MAIVGTLLLYIALGLSSYALIISFLGLRSNEKSHLTAGRRYSGLSVVAVFGACIVLLRAFIIDDFSFAYVFRNSERSLALVYKISAFWAGQSGSLLLWLLVLSLIILYIHLHKRYRADGLDVKLAVVVNLVRIFFIGLLLLVDSPFETLSPIPANGTGLNHMLQSLGMVIHPPVLFIGYSGFLIPFALMTISLLSGQKDGSWLRQSRLWVLFSWTMLTAGIVTGGQWAYTELGWGGYWAWDPVENASLFPWLTATALIHIYFLPYRGAKQKLWGFSLIAVTFILTIFGTFLTRSGILDSVHAFSDGMMGYIFLVGLAIISGLCLYLLISRYHLLIDKEDNKNKRRTTVLIIAGNFILLLILAGVFLGTMAPLITKFIGGRQVALDEGFYNQIAAPLFLVLVMLMGLSTVNSRQEAILPIVVSLVVGIISYRGYNHLLSALAFASGAFGLASHFQRLIKGYFKKQLSLHRFGAYLVHFGIIFMVFGITASQVFSEDMFITVQTGDRFTIRQYELEYQGLEIRWGISDYTVSSALAVYRGGEYLGEFSSEKIFTQDQQQPATNVGIFRRINEDLYLNLAGWDADEAQLHIHIFPLVNWIWFGSGLIYLGMLIIMLMGAYNVRSVKHKES